MVILFIMHTRSVSGLTIISFIVHSFLEVVFDSVINIFICCAEATVFLTALMVDKEQTSKGLVW